MSVHSNLRRRAGRDVEIRTAELGKLSQQFGQGNLRNSFIQSHLDRLSRVLLVVDGRGFGAEHFDVMLGFSRHAIGKLEWRVSGQTVNAATSLGEIKRPRLYGLT